MPSPAWKDELGTRVEIEAIDAGLNGNRTVQAERRGPSERLAALPSNRCDVRLPPLFLPFHSERREKGASTTSYPLLFCPCFREESTEEALTIYTRRGASEYFQRNSLDELPLQAVYVLCS